VSELLSVSALAKRYGAAAHQALAGVSFRLHTGELVALVGPNGAGKTTLLSILAGVLPPSAGTVSSSLNRPCGWVPQQPALYSKLSVAENLELLARLERVPDPPGLVREMLEQTGLAERAGEPAGRLSGGNRQRVNIAIGLIGEPPVLALDEPSSSLDPAQRERLWQFVLARVAGGTSVLFSTHNVSEAQRHAGRVLVLADGRLVFDGPPQALLEAGGEAAGGDLERALVRFLRELPGDASTPPDDASTPRSAEP